MKLSMHNWMRPEPIEVTLQRLARCGYDGIEISGEPARYDSAYVRDLLQQHGLRAFGSVTLMTEGRDLIHEDRYVRIGTIQYYKDCAKLVADLGGDLLCLIPSTVGKTKPMASPEEEWRWAVEGLREVVDYAGALGVRIGIEPLNRFETYFINRHDQALALADAVDPSVGVVLDAFHINIEEADPYAAIRATGSRLVDFHVADNNRYPPGQGAWDWHKLIGTLREIGYTGPLTVEFVVPVDRTPAARRRIEGQAEEATTVGHEKFLRDHGTGILSAEYYEECTRASAQYLRRLMSQ